MFLQLRDVLVQIVSDETMQGDMYVIYDSSDGSFTTLTPEEYELGGSIADFLSREARPQRAPNGSGWKNGGTYKGDVSGAYKAVKKLKKEIPANQNFELHVEYNSNGTITVWWRPV